MAPSTTIRRLLKEVAELSPNSANPNPAFHAAPVSDSDLHEWHFTLLGPPSPSPYAGGLYHGRISLPTQYPLKPPNFRFLTPSGRFEVNREICLSISGFHEETWMPAWGVRTALTALRSFMAEPGTAGQVGGLESSDAVKTRLAAESKSWRCSDCGKTNTDTMQLWWTTCRERGVKVDDEDMGLEALPEGMSVQAFDRSKAKGKEKAKEHDLDSTTGVSAPESISLATTTTSIAQMSPPATSSAPLEPMNHIDEQIASDLHASNSEDVSRVMPTRTVSISRTTSESSATVTSAHARSQSHVHTQPQPQNQAQIQQRQEPQGVTLDRAITVIFLALCIMIIKKIFLSSSSSGYGASDDWEIGLSREY